MQIDLDKDQTHQFCKRLSYDVIGGELSEDDFALQKVKEYIASNIDQQNIMDAQEKAVSEIERTEL